MHRHSSKLVCVATNYWEVYIFGIKRGKRYRLHHGEWGCVVIKQIFWQMANFSGWLLKGKWHINIGNIHIAAELEIYQSSWIRCFKCLSITPCESEMTCGYDKGRGGINQTSLCTWHGRCNTIIDMLRHQRISSSCSRVSSSVSVPFALTNEAQRYLEVPQPQ